MAKAKEFGIRRAIKLNVAGAYHSRLMQSAQDQLAAELAGVTLQQPGVPVVCNYAATPVAEAAEIRAMLEKQVTGSVRWTASIQALIAMGHRQFLELGPGKVIAGLVAKIDKDAVVHSIEDLPSLEATVGRPGRRNLLKNFRRSEKRCCAVPGRPVASAPPERDMER